ncbi:unnamed protein product, partial [Ranitomeya imitator]
NLDVKHFSPEDLTVKLLDDFVRSTENTVKDRTITDTSPGSFTPPLSPPTKLGPVLSLLLPLRRWNFNLLWFPNCFPTWIQATVRDPSLSPVRRSPPQPPSS